jgi:hypothetical protein
MITGFFGLRSSPGILKTQKNRTFRKQDSFPSSDEGCDCNYSCNNSWDQEVRGNMREYNKNCDEACTHLKFKRENEVETLHNKPKQRTKSIKTLDWIDMARDGDRWRALVNAVLSLRVP